MEEEEADGADRRQAQVVGVVRLGTLRALQHYAESLRRELAQHRLEAVAAQRAQRLLLADRRDLARLLH